MSMKSLYGCLAMAGMLMAASGDMYEERARWKPKPPKKLSEEDELRINDAMESQKHDFNINGTIIRARNRKTAKMIYSRRKNK